MSFTGQLVSFTGQVAMADEETPPVFTAEQEEWIER